MNRVSVRIVTWLAISLISTGGYPSSAQVGSLYQTASLQVGKVTQVFSVAPNAILIFQSTSGSPSLVIVRATGSQPTSVQAQITSPLSLSTTITDQAWHALNASGTDFAAASGTLTNLTSSPISIQIAEAAIVEDGSPFASQNGVGASAGRQSIAWVAVDGASKHITVSVTSGVIFETKTVSVNQYRFDPSSPFTLSDPHVVTSNSGIPWKWGFGIGASTPASWYLYQITSPVDFDDAVTSGQ
ncbi:MAG: hypothetical protein ACLQVD_17570 [Capsulimonadaceae bacterium]